MKLTRLAIRSFPGEAPPGARDRILDAADEALGTMGFRHMRIEDLARAAGIAKGTVYLSFASKPEIALACIDRMAGQVLERMRAIAAGKGPARERLRKALVERVLLRLDYARTHPSSVDEILAAIRPSLLARREEHFAEEARVLASMLHGPGAAETARAMIIATNALLPYSLSVREMGRRAEVARKADRVARLVVRGALSHSRRRSA
jgi:AcrR family transcriptional regulator